MQVLAFETICGKKEKLILNMFYKKPRIAPGFFPVGTAESYGLDITFIRTVPSLLILPSASEAFTVWRSVYH